MAGNNYGSPYGGGNSYGGGSNPYGGGGNPYGGGSNPYGGGGNPYGGGSNPFGGGGNSFGGNNSFGGGYQPNSDPNRRANFSNVRVEKNFGFIILIFSVLAGLIAFLFGEVIYRMRIAPSNPSGNSVLFVGVYFCAAGLIIAIMLFIAARISGITFSAAGLIIGLVISMALLPAAAGLEYVYEMEFELTPQTVQTNTLGNTIFLIDESGSMGVNDPQKQRITATQDLLNSADANMQYAVYAFANRCELVQPVTTVQNGVRVATDQADVGGGTEIASALESIMSDIEGGVISIENPQVILLTDGSSSDRSGQLQKIIDRYAEKGIRISTIGLGSADKNYLNNISSTTGGQSVMVSNAGELGNAFTTIALGTDTPRNLLSKRYMTGDGIYALMRVAFIALLGLLITFAKIGLVGQSSNKLLLTLSSIIASILAGVLLEFGLKLFLGEMAGRLIMMLLLALTITMVQSTRLNLIGGGPDTGIKNY